MAVVETNAKLGQTLSEKEALLVELVKKNERLVRAKRMLSVEVYN